MLAIIYILILIALIKLLLITEKPLLCAVVFALIAAFFGLLLGAGLAVVAIVMVVNFGFAWLYFWLLDRFQATAIFWVVLFGGILLRPAAALFVG